ISALVSIGGGSLTVPFLLWQNIDIRRAIGTSAALGMPLSLAGTAGFIFAGAASDAVPVAGSLGFVYLPAVAMISLASICTAPLGAAAAHALPALAVKRVFAVLQIALSIQMLRSGMQTTESSAAACRSNWMRQHQTDVTADAGSQVHFTPLQKTGMVGVFSERCKNSPSRGSVCELQQYIMLAAEKQQTN